MEGAPAQDAETVARELLSGRSTEFDPRDVPIDDAAVLEQLHPAVREWWVDQFGPFVPDNGGFFTPPQKEAIPLIDEGTNTLVCAPTGSGKCVKPDTPLIIEEDGVAEVVRAAELLDRRESKLADVDGDGELYESGVESYSLNDGSVETRTSHVYTEPYDGDLHRIETTYGRTVEVTPEHPLLVETCDGPEWRRAADISKGDRIGVPKRLELPEQPIDLDVENAVKQLEKKCPVVLTESDSKRLGAKLEAADGIDDLTESELRRLMVLADVSFSDVADKLGISLGTVHRIVTGETTHCGAELLEALHSEFEPLGGTEILVQNESGGTSRFTYPSTVDEVVALLAAFVLAEGFVGEYESGGMLAISQKRRTDLLKRAREAMQQRFDMEFVRKNDNDYVINDGTFATFFSALLDIAPGKSRGVSLPDWVLNAPKPVKRTFISVFVSLEGEVRENEIRVVQANEMKIEQLTYLFLSFGVFPARGVTSKSATNTDEQTEREYYELALRGMDNLEIVLSEFDIRHPNVETIQRHIKGTTSGTHVDKYQFDYQDIRSLSTYYGDDQEFQAQLGNVYEVVRRSGYITESALTRLGSELEALPDGGAASAVATEIESIRDRNVAWLEVKETTTVPYEGRIVDLSVPDTHNFVGGRGAMYLHNTLASFTAIIDDLFSRAEAADDGLDNSVYCLYVSPLKSLANDIHRNLTRPLEGVTANLEDREESVEIRHAIRHGDTSSSERQRMLEETPHILNTTPETLAILLNSPKFKEKLETVEYVVVDEIHSLADNKRGTHLSVSLERLERLCEASPTRIGCSATVEPLEAMAEFLVGGDPPRGSGTSGERSDPRDGTRDDRTGEWTPREYEIVDARFVREFDLELTCPTDDLVNTPRELVTDRFYDQLTDLVAEHTNTLVFTNTRSGAERVLHNLRERGEFDETNSGCHHGSLSKARRTEIEEGLKAGALDVVTTSTSLELGVDMPHVDLVVQVGSPKSVASLLQRVGRAGHQLGETVKGRVVALDRDELIECAVMVRKAEQGFVDRVFVPENAHDVAVQQVYGMAINGPLPEATVRETLRSAYPYRGYGDAEFEQLFRYLTAGYDGMEDRNVYAKVWRDENDPPGGEHHYEDFEPGTPLVGKRGRLARVIYMTNIGTIPDSFTCDVYTRSGDEWVGQLDEEYLDTLEDGDVFVLGGSRYEYRYRRGSKVYVDPTTARATVPSWYSERLPLSYDLGCEILAFQREVLERLDGGGPPAVRRWLREFPVDENTVRALARMFDAQVRFAGPRSVSTDGRLAVEVELNREEYRRNYYVHSNYGRRFNDGLSRLLAYRCAQRADANVTVAVADHGFTLSMPLNRKVDLAGILRDIDPGEVRADLRAGLDGTDLLKRYFRINATRALMILKRYKGYEKSASQQQVSSEMLIGFAREREGFAVMEETYREILEDKLDVGALESFVADVDAGAVDVALQQVGSPSPRAFGLATLMASDVVLAEDESAVLQEFHDRVMAEIGEGTEPITVETDD